MVANVAPMVVSDMVSATTAERVTGCAACGTAMYDDKCYSSHDSSSLLRL